MKHMILLPLLCGCANFFGPAECGGMMTKEQAVSLAETGLSLVWGPILQRHGDGKYDAAQWRDISAAKAGVDAAIVKIKEGAAGFDVLLAAVNAAVVVLNGAADPATP